MTKAINVNDVNLKTAFVQVNQLILSNRKMTLQIFKQIEDENIIDFNEAKLLGTPWGYINYFWSEVKEKRKEDTIHLLWQKGNELRRCFINGNYKDKFSEVTYEDNEHPTTITFQTEDLFQDNPLLTCDFSDKEAKELVSTYGSYPKFRVFSLEGFQEKMKDVIDAWNRLSYKNWTSNCHINGKTKKFREHFWSNISEKFPDYNIFREESRQAALYAIKTAYEIYLNNHLYPCNELLSEIKKDLGQLYI